MKTRRQTIRAKREKKQQESFSRSVFISTIIHIVVIIFVLVFPSNFSIRPTPPIDLVWIELPKGSGEDIYGLKDVKRLPETTIQQQEQEIKALKPIKEEKQAMPEPKLDKTVSVTSAKPKKKTAKRSGGINSALAKIDNRLKKREIPEAAQVDSTGEGYKYGTSDKPLRVARDDADLLKYRALVRARIMRQWVLPGALTQLTPDKRPTVRIIVNINKSGNVMSKSFAKRSNMESLNASAMRAIDRASPFPIPPERIKWEAFNEGFLVEFNARSR